MKAQIYHDEDEENIVRLFNGRGDFICDLEIPVGPIQLDEADKRLRMLHIVRVGGWEMADFGFEATLRFKHEVKKK